MHIDVSAARDSRWWRRQGGASVPARAVVAASSDQSTAVVQGRKSLVDNQYTAMRIFCTSGLPGDATKKELNKGVLEIHQTRKRIKA